MFVNEMKNEDHKVELLPLNLQFFNDGEGDNSGGENFFQGGYNPEEEIPGLNKDPESTLLTGNEPQDPEGDPEGNPEGDPNEGDPVDPQDPNQQQQPEYLDFGGRQIDPADPEQVKQAYQDFQEAQRYITQLQQQNQQIMQMQQQMQQQQQPQQQEQQQEPQKTPEEMNEELLDMLYENPKEFMSKMQEQMNQQVESRVQEIQQRYEPIAKEREIQQEVEQIRGKFPDFDDHTESIKEVIQNIGPEKADQLGLENLYLMARGQNSMQQQQQQPSPEQLVNDPEFLKNHVFNNPQVQQQFLQEYANNKQQEQPPKVISNSGTQQVAPEDRPKTISQAGKNVRQRMRQG